MKLADVLEAGQLVDAAQFEIDGVRPELAVRPEHEEGIAEILRAANDAGAAVVPQGGRTALALGRPLERYDLALDTTGLAQVSEYAPEDLTITVQAGMTLRTLQSTLGEYGQYLPIDPPPDDSVTVGGLLATARPGAWRGHLPAARDLILGMSVAMADGTIARSGGRVVKNVSGFDMHRLHTGALGTLGVITTASFKVLPKPAQTRAIVYSCCDLAEAGDLAQRLWGANLAVRTIAILEARAARAAGLGTGPLVLIELAGVADAIGRSAELAAELSERADAAAEPVAPDALGRLRSLGAAEAEATVARIGVPATSVGSAIREAARHGLAAWGYVAAGAVWVWQSESAPEAILALRRSVAAAGGFLQIESGSVALRHRVDPFGETEQELLKALKDRFDPARTLNPGRWAAEV